MSLPLMNNKIAQWVLWVANILAREGRPTLLRRREAVQEVRYPSTGRQIAFARVATALALMSVGALAVGALAIGRMVIRSLNIRDGRIGRLSIDELEVGRLRVQELITEREQRQQ